MSTVRLHINARTAAIGLPLGTTHFAFAVGTYFSSTTRIFTLSTMTAVTLGVYAFFITYFLTCEAGDDTLTTLTSLTLFTTITALTAVVERTLQVEASPLALGLASGTINSTNPIRTQFSIFALGSTLATILSIFEQAHTRISAIGLSFGALRLQTFPLIAIETSVATLCFFGKLIATFAVLHTDLVLTREIYHLGSTLKAASLALVGRTIWHTLVLLTFFKVFTDFPPLAFSPNTSTTALCTLLASFTSLG